jgi:hypothetical protein
MLTRRTILQKYTPFIHANATAAWSSRGRDGTISSWWDTPRGDRDDDIARRWIRQVSVETLGSAVSAVMCAVRVDELLRMLEAEES